MAGRIWKLVYKSKFGDKVKMLRRVSLGSSVVSLSFMPAAFLMDSGVLPVAGQVALISTVVFSSLSSTTLLQLVAQPYVSALYESSNLSKDSEKQDRLLAAEYFDILGRQRRKEFYLSDAEQKVTHPFASFALKSNRQPFYVYGENVEDSEIRKKLTKEK